MANTPLILEPGIYTNVFPVSLPDAPLETMSAGRDKFPDLRSLREEFERGGGNVRLFADRESVYAYDANAQTLQTRGFRPKEIDLSRRPDFAKRLIVEGVAAAVAPDGYEKRDRIGRLTIYQVKPRASVAGGRLRLHLGYDLRALYWRSEPDEAWNFGLIVDVTWSIRDDTGALGSAAIASYGAMLEIARIQGEYLPGGNRINTEVSRQRFQDHILPFVRKYERLPFPSGNAQLLPEPVRVVLGAQR